MGLLLWSFTRVSLVSGGFKALFKVGSEFNYVWLSALDGIMVCLRLA